MLQKSWISFLYIGHFQTKLKIALLKICYKQNEQITVTADKDLMYTAELVFGD